MGLFKEFKDDLSSAVNELVPGGEEANTAENVDNLVVDTLGEDVDVESELSKLDGLLEKVEEPKAGAPVMRESATQRTETKSITKEENTKSMSDTTTINNMVNPAEIEDETSLITASTTLKGDLMSAGSFDIQGTINGNVSCNGKIVVTGTINGNTSSSEFFADVAKIEGEVVSTGTVKIGAGSVIIGNISAASAVIAGAVKGDIDVQGPVVVDTSAVIMGNIKSRSVQINNGAVIEGFCSQCYADIDVQGLFEGK